MAESEESGQKNIVDKTPAQKSGIISKISPRLKHDRELNITTSGWTELEKFKGDFSDYLDDTAKLMAIARGSAEITDGDAGDAMRHILLMPPRTRSIFILFAKLIIAFGGVIIAFGIKFNPPGVESFLLVIGGILLSAISGFAEELLRRARF